MNDQHYVIQWRVNSDSPWLTLDRKYPTREIAEATMEAKRKAGLACEKWRIAESYTVVRYKAIKE